MGEKPNILIAVPAYGGDIKTQTFGSIFGMTNAFRQAGYRYTVQTQDKADITLVRNIFASNLLASPEFTHLLQIDWDMTYRDVAPIRLIEADKPVIGFCCPKRSLDLNKLAAAVKSAPFKMAVARASEFNISMIEKTTLPKDASVMRVDRIGMAITLIRRDALERMIETGNVRKHENHNFAHNVSGPLYGFFDHLLIDGGRMLLEDQAFCERWRTLCNGEVHAIIDEYVGHVGEFTYVSRLTDLRAKS